MLVSHSDLCHFACDLNDANGGGSIYCCSIAQLALRVVTHAFHRAICHEKHGVVVPRCHLHDLVAHDIGLVADEFCLGARVVRKSLAHLLEVHFGEVVERIGHQVACHVDPPPILGKLLDLFVVVSWLRVHHCNPCAPVEPDLGRCRSVSCNRVEVRKVKVLAGHDLVETHFGDVTGVLIDRSVVVRCTSDTRVDCDSHESFEHRPRFRLDQSINGIVVVQVIVNVLLRLISTKTRVGRIYSQIRGLVDKDALNGGKVCEPVDNVRLDLGNGSVPHVPASSTVIPARFDVAHHGDVVIFQS